MKRFYYLLISIFFMLQANAQYSYVVVDSMKDGGHFKDNALLITPTGYEYPIPAFTTEEASDNNGLSFPSITFTKEAVGEVTGIFRIWPSFDYIFPDVIDRADEDTIIVEFDVLYDEVRGSGESGRMNITLLTELPDTGITLEDFGIPAYHFWLFNGTYSGALSYGGSFGSEDPVNPSWNSGAGGIYYNEPADGGDAVLFPNSPNYPEVPYAKDFSGSAKVSETTWMHFTWVIAPQMMHLFYRETGMPKDQDQEMLFMAIPEDDDDIQFINEVHETFAATMPPAYQWFETVNGIRFFNRGATANFNLTNVMITKTGIPVTTFSEFRSSKGVVDEGDGTYDLNVILENPSQSDSTAVDVVLIQGDASQIGNYETQTIVFDAGSDEQASITIDIADEEEIGTDTLVFELQNIRGGFYPSMGAKTQFTLIINDNDASGIGQLLKQNVRLYPNPVKGNLYISFGSLKLTEPAVVTLYSLNGSMVIRKSVQKDTEINVNELPNGLYSAEIESEHGIIQQKILISN